VGKYKKPEKRVMIFHTNPPFLTLFGGFFYRKEVLSSNVYPAPRTKKAASRQESGSRFFIEKQRISDK